MLFDVNPIGVSLSWWVDIVASLVCENIHQRKFGGIFSIYAISAKLLHVCIIIVIVVFLLFSIPSMCRNVTLLLFCALAMT